MALRSVSILSRLARYRQQMTQALVPAVATSATACTSKLALAPQQHGRSIHAQTESGDKLLLTPGPLTTRLSTKESMLHDYGSRDKKFIELNRRVCEHLVELADPSAVNETGSDPTYVCVPIQGSGTFAVEATLRSLVPSTGAKIALHADGVYGKRMASICENAGIAFEATADLNEFLNLLENNDITHAAVVHCETSTGRLMDLEPVAKAAEKAGVKLIVDAMSSFGAIAIDARKLNLTAIAASSNKCLEGVPGLGYAVIKRTDLLDCPKGTARSLSLDLNDQYTNMLATSQYRFTPPTHCLVALDHALALHRSEGGTAGRGARYTSNHKILVDGLTDIGFETYLPFEEQAPIIVTFLSPRDPNFDFQHFYDTLSDMGFVIYPGKLTNRETFRIGCIGSLSNDDIRLAVDAIRQVCNDMNITDFTPQ